VLERAVVLEEPPADEVLIGDVLRRQHTFDATFTDAD